MLVKMLHKRKKMKKLMICRKTEIDGQALLLGNPHKVEKSQEEEDMARKKK